MWLCRKKWQDLGDMSKDDVQRKFSELMVTASDNAFKQWVLQRIAVEEEEAERRCVHSSAVIW